MKIPSVGAELFHEDEQTNRQSASQPARRTDMKKLIAVLCKFANAPKNRDMFINTKNEIIHANDQEM
jgi:hypothetical protein